GTAERFEGVQRPGPAPGAPRSSGADLDRFGPEPPPRIELLESEAGVQPFTRCMRCGMDHGVFATVCTNCNASLDTAAQREFNEKLWAKRREEAAREEAASAERRVLAERAQAEMARAQRAMGEELAREVGERERLRLRMEGGWGGGSEGSLSAPIGLRLLRALPDWRWQLGAAASALAALGGLTAIGLSGHPGALLVAILLGILLLVPGWRADGP
ncbi:MAG TPA: hypothetical protein VIV57_07865, partial [Anaeromyxobacter sp.]